MADWDTALSSASKAPSPIPKAGDWDAALSQMSERGPTLSRQPRQWETKPNEKYDPSVSTESYIWNELKKVPGGLVGLAPDAVEWISRKAAGMPTDFGNVTRKIQALTGADPNMRPPGPGSEKVGTIAQNLAGSVPFAAGAWPARGAMGAVTEMLSGLGGGVGQLIGREMAGSGSPVAELTGNALGSMSGYRAGNMVEKAVPLGKMAFEAMASKEARAATVLKAKGIVEGTPEYQSLLQGQMNAAKGEILSDLAKAYAQEDMTAIAKLLDNYDAIKQKIPGFKASIGEITGNEPALAMQAKLESRNISALEERGARLRGNQEAIANARESIVPSSPGAGRAAINNVQSTLDEQLRALGAKETSLSSDLADASGKMVESATPLAEAGTTIKAASKEGYLSSRSTANAKYQAFRNAIGDDVPSEAGNVVAKVKELGDKFVFDKQPEVLSLIPRVAQGGAKEGKVFTPDEGFVKTQTSEPSTMTVAQLDDLTAVANRDMNREKAKTNPDRKVIAQLQSIKEEARTAIESTLEERGNTDALTKYREANRYFGQEHAPKYLEGVNLKLRMKDALNEERVKPESVVSAYFKPNGTTEAKRFITQFSDNGAAKETLARGVFDLYKKEVIDAGGGVINSGRDAMFKRKYAAALDEYPWIAKRLEKNVIGEEIARRVEESRAMRGEIATSDVAKAVGTRDVEAFLDKAMADKRFMLSALSKMDTENRKNMAIAVLNKAWDEGGKGSGAVNKVLDNEENLKMLMKFGFGAKEGGEHLNNVKLLARALEINEKAPKTSPMTALSEDSLKGLTGTSWLQVMSALRAVGRRPGSGDWFAMVFGTQFIKAKVDAQKIEILKEQLFDPKLLQATLQEAKSKGATSMADIGDQAKSRGKQIVSKLWDLTKAAAGKGAPTAAMKRAPVAAVAAED